jgi:uncharacterized protein YutE (UPF0331/DUF86 family)
MENLKKRHRYLLNALDTVKEEITRYDKYIDNEEFGETVRRSLIQCFEYSIELTCKYLKHHMTKIRNLKVSGTSRDTIAMGISNGMLTENEADSLSEALRDRNKSSHIYSEEVAEILASNIPKYHRVMETVAKRLGKELDEMA